MKKRSPIKKPPLRQAGESAQSLFENIMWDKWVFWLFMAAWIVLLAAFEWIRYLVDFRLSPWFMTGLAVAACGVAIWRMKKAMPVLRQYRQGIQGEKAVGQWLEELRAQGYKVIHDLEGEGFNVDHVLIGPTGVYAVETKTISKPQDRKAEITFDGEHVLVDGFTPDRDPVKQARAAARYVSQTLAGCMGEAPFVRPILLYPGWYIQRRTKKADLWVLNENLLQAYLDHEDDRLSDREVCTITDALATHVRAGINAKKQ